MATLPSGVDRALTLVVTEVALRVPLGAGRFKALFISNAEGDGYGCWEAGPRSLGLLWVGVGTGSASKAMD